MADLTLPGAIPGLLRRCSCIVVTGGRYAGRRGILAEDPDGCPRVLVLLDASGGDDVVLEVLDVSDIALDLSDPTGLIHAVWWMASLDEQRFPAAVLALGLYGPAFDVAFEQALIGRPLDEREIGMIRRVGLYLAGVSDAD